MNTTFRVVFKTFFKTSLSTSGRLLSPGGFNQAIKNMYELLLTIFSLSITLGVYTFRFFPSSNQALSRNPLHMCQSLITIVFISAISCTRLTRDTDVIVQACPVIQTEAES